MVVRLVSFEPTSFPPFREIPDFDFGFAVNGQSENLRVAVGDLVALATWAKMASVSGSFL
jgi:hypothetical protein